MAGIIARACGRVRGLVAPNLSENMEDQPFQMNNRGDQCVALALPERAEIVRMGNSYIGIGATTAPVAAMPTTAAHLSIWNGENDDGLSYIIDYIGGYISTSAGAAINIVMAAQLNLGKAATALTADVTPKSLSGRANYRGKGRVDNNATVVNDSAWHTVGTTLVCANTANLMLAVETPVYGRYIVPPGGIFSVASLCNAAASASVVPWFIWHEVKLILG